MQIITVLLCRRLHCWQLPKIHSHLGWETIQINFQLFRFSWLDNLRNDEYDENDEMYTANVNEFLHNGHCFSTGNCAIKVTDFYVISY